MPTDALEACTSDCARTKVAAGLRTRPLPKKQSPSVRRGSAASCFSGARLWHLRVRRHWREDLALEGATNPSGSVLYIGYRAIAVNDEVCHARRFATWSVCLFFRGCVTRILTRLPWPLTPLGLQLWPASDRVAAVSQQCQFTIRPRGAPAPCRAACA